MALVTNSTVCKCDFVTDGDKLNTEATTACGVFVESNDDVEKLTKDLTNIKIKTINKLEELTFNKNTMVLKDLMNKSKMASPVNSVTDMMKHLDITEGNSFVKKPISLEKKKLFTISKSCLEVEDKLLYTTEFCHGGKLVPRPGPPATSGARPSQYYGDPTESQPTKYKRSSFIGSNNGAIEDLHTPTVQVNCFFEMDEKNVFDWSNAASLPIFKDVYWSEGAENIVYENKSTDTDSGSTSTAAEDSPTSMPSPFGSSFSPDSGYGEENGECALSDGEQQLPEDLADYILTNRYKGRDHISIAHLTTLVADEQRSGATSYSIPSVSAGISKIVPFAGERQTDLMPPLGAFDGDQTGLVPTQLNPSTTTTTTTTTAAATQRTNSFAPNGNFAFQFPPVVSVSDSALPRCNEPPNGQVLAQKSASQNKGLAPTGASPPSAIHAPVTAAILNNTYSDVRNPFSIQPSLTRSPFPSTLNSTRLDPPPPPATFNLPIFPPDIAAVVPNSTMRQEFVCYNPAPQTLPLDTRPSQLSPEETQQLVGVRTAMSACPIQMLKEVDKDGDSKVHDYVIQFDRNDSMKWALQSLLERLEEAGCIQEYINLKNYKKQTPLFIAAFLNFHEALKILLRFGADPNILKGQYEGPGPLHCAVSHGDKGLKCVGPLVQHPRCDLNLKNTEGLSALQVACKDHRTVVAIKCVQLLLEAGADTLCKEPRSGHTALHYAVATSDVHLMHLFMKISAGTLSALIRSKKFDDTTALHVAAGLTLQEPSAHADIIHMLIDNGAEITAVDCYGKYARDLATNKTIHDLLRLQRKKIPSRSSLSHVPSHVPVSCSPNYSIPSHQQLQSMAPSPVISVNSMSSAMTVRSVDSSCVVDSSRFIDSSFFVDSSRSSPGIYQDQFGQGHLYNMAMSMVATQYTCTNGTI